MRRHQSIFMIAASLTGLATMNCSQTNQGDSGSPDSAWSTERRDASGTGGIGAGGSTGGAAGAGAVGGSARGGASGGTSAAGGSGTPSGSGGAGTVDASGVTDGKTGTGGSGGSGAGADSRASDGSPAEVAVPDAGNDGPAKDGAAVDMLDADVPVDSAPSGGSTCTLSGGATTKTPTVYVIGDSTASVYGSDLYPRMGWAQPLQDFFAPACATVFDKALSGRSSKSFWDEGAWAPIKSDLRAGDYVIIQFGHNDEKSDDATRYTEPFTTYQDYLSKYIDDTLAKGATPILATPINRNQWSGTTVKDSHGDYPVAMRQLAQKRSVSLVDATALTKAYFERIGQAATTKLFMTLSAGEYPNYPSGNTDNTHLQEKGARLIAQMILADLHRQNLAPGTLAKTVPVAP